MLTDSINLKGFNFILGLITLISIYPTFLIIKAGLEFKKLDYRNKVILYFWFLFTVSFTYIDQVAMKMFIPVLAFNEVNPTSLIYVIITGIQLYFIATSFSLLFAAIPIFYLDQTSEPWKVRWQKVKEEWRDTIKCELGNFVEYQINFVQFFYVTLISGILIYLDIAYHIRLYLIFVYTVVFPILFFYLKWTPESNLEENDMPNSDRTTSNDDRATDNIRFK
jgi:hypothetical protein